MEQQQDGNVSINKHAPQHLNYHESCLTLKINLMKNIKYIILLLLTYNMTSAQIAIGKESVSNTSVSLEFGSANRGMVLPWVTSIAAVSSVREGSLAYDLTDHKVKLKIAAGWKDMSGDTTGTTIDPLTNIDGVLIQEVATENTDAKASIGEPTSASGILVLEDTNKAMILPQVASPHLNIINPAPGMMVYDTTSNQLAFFNGKMWSFWKPSN